VVRTQRHQQFLAQLRLVDDDAGIARRGQPRDQCERAVAVARAAPVSPPPRASAATGASAGR